MPPAGISQEQKFGIPLKTAGENILYLYEALMMPAGLKKEIIITDLHRGDEATFRVLYEKYHHRLTYFASRLLPEGESAEDAVQEAFIKLWQKRTYFYRPDAIKAFLYISVKNYCLNLCRHDQVARKYGHAVCKADMKEETDGAVLESEVLEKVYRALQKLPNGCRQVIHLGYFQGLKNEDVANRLHVSVNTVKTQKKRGLHLLRAVLKVSVWWFLFPNF